jgi:hypothetical protein
MSAQNMLHERGKLDSAIAQFDQAIAIESSSLSRKTESGYCSKNVDCRADAPAGAFTKTVMG